MEKRKLLFLNGRRPPQPPDIPEVEALLCRLPQATLLVDLAKERIVLGNQAAAELSGYTPAMLRGLPAEKLFPLWKEHIQLSGEQIVEITPPEGEGKPVRWVLEKLPDNLQRAILTLEPVARRVEPPAAPQQPSKVWDCLTRMVSASNQTTLVNSLYLTLEGVRWITGIGTAAVYLPEQSGQGLERVAGWGDAHRLPGLLPPQDIPVLRSAGQWHPGQRVRCVLQRAVQSAGFGYLGWAPLDNGKTISGLVALTGACPSESEEVADQARSLAGLLSNVIEEHSRTMNLLHQLQQDQFDLTVAKSVEDGIQEGIVVVWPDQRVFYLNRAAEMMLGYMRNEARGQAVDKILIGTESLGPALEAARSKAGGSNRLQMRLYRRNGDLFPALVKIRALTGQNQQLLGLVILILDLSEKEQIREQTQQLERRAELGEVIAMFAHEVRNPINNLSTGLQLMEFNLPEDDPQRETLVRLQQDCDRLEELMKSVLAFSKPLDYELSPVDLGVLMQSIVDRFRMKMAKANVQHNLQIEADLPLVMGNTRALEQVFTNLINNSLQAMQATGGHLAVRVQYLSDEQPPWVEVSIADTGPGIPRETLERIFQPFYTTKREGSGLGLPISKRIITFHKGIILPTSFPGGTVFQVRIPAILDH